MSGQIKDVAEILKVLAGAVRGYCAPYMAALLKPSLQGKFLYSRDRGEYAWQLSKLIMQEIATARESLHLSAESSTEFEAKAQETMEFLRRKLQEEAQGEEERAVLLGLLLKDTILSLFLEPFSWDREEVKSRCEELGLKSPV